MLLSCERESLLTLRRLIYHTAYALAANTFSGHRWANTLYADGEIQKEADSIARRSLKQAGATDNQVELFMRGAVNELSKPENFSVVLEAFERLKSWRDEKAAKDAQRELSNRF